MTYLNQLNFGQRLIALEVARIMIISFMDIPREVGAIGITIYFLVKKGKWVVMGDVQLA
jgi:hypothetical protein